MDRRTFMASGVLSAIGVSACGGGGSNQAPLAPAVSVPDITRYVTGWLQMPAEDYRRTPEAVNGNFPSIGGFDQFDLSNTDFLAQTGWPALLPSPDPNGQGRQPSCTAWAVGFAAATATLRYAGIALDSPISPADLFAKIQRRSGADCVSGSTISAAMDTLVQEGAATLTSAPYSDLACGFASPLPAFVLDGFSRVPSSDVVSIRGALQMMQPVCFGLNVDTRFQNLTLTNALYMPNGTGSGHALSVIGYDDKSQRYKIMNSWGTGWGAGGFCWITYVDFARYAQDVCIPYLRRPADNALLARATSNEAIPIVAQHIASKGYGSGVTGSYGVGVEAGWSAPLDIRSASVAVLDGSQNILFDQTFEACQIARGIRFGTRIPDAATSYTYVRASISGVDRYGTALTLTAFTKPSRR